MKSAFKTLALAGAVGGLLGGEAQAASYLYTLDQSNQDAALADGVPYLTVLIEDAVWGSDTNAIKFTVDADNSRFNESSDFGITAFAFNQAVGAPAIADGNIVAPSGWSGNVAPPPNQFDGFGKFLGSADGTGSMRLDPLVFWIVGVAGDTPLSYVAPSTGSAAQGNAWFAAHLAGFTIPGSSVTSAYFGGGNGAELPPAGGPTVPVPAAFWLLVSAIAGLIGIGRRGNACPR